MFVYHVYNYVHVYIYFCYVYCCLHCNNMSLIWICLCMGCIPPPPTHACMFVLHTSCGHSFVLVKLRKTHFQTIAIALKILFGADFFLNASFLRKFRFSNLWKPCVDMCVSPRNVSRTCILFSRPHRICNAYSQPKQSFMVYAPSKNRFPLPFLVILGGPLFFFYITIGMHCSSVPSVLLVYAYIRICYFLTLRCFSVISYHVQVRKHVWEPICRRTSVRIHQI